MLFTRQCRDLDAIKTSCLQQAYRRLRFNLVDMVPKLQPVALAETSALACQMHAVWDVYEKHAPWVKMIIGPAGSLTGVRQVLLRLRHAEHIGLTCWLDIH